jgi:HK97 gp10 family phage protein
MAAVLGLGALQAKLASLAAAVERAGAESVAESAEAIAGRMRADAPVDTGELRGSIEVVRMDGESADVGAAAAHAHFVEFGTSRSPAQPFALPAAEQERNEMPGRVTEAVRRAVR